MNWLHTIVTAIGILVGIIGIILFFFERKEKINLKKIMSADAMAAHKITGILLGNTQVALAALNKADQAAARQSIGQAEGQAQTLFTNSIKSLWINRGYTRDDIDRWVRDGVIMEGNARAFLAYIEEPSPKKN